MRTFGLTTSYSLMFAAATSSFTACGENSGSPSNATIPKTVLIVTPPDTEKATAGFGPRVLVGPQAVTTCPEPSVNVSPGDHVQTVIDQHIAGAVYCFAAGDLRPLIHAADNC
jgi:hypothetical protein